MHFSLFIYFNILSSACFELSSTLIVLAASQHRYMLNTICCIYSKLSADGEQLLYSKHVRDRLLK